MSTYYASARPPYEKSWRRLYAGRGGQPRWSRDQAARGTFTAAEVVRLRAWARHRSMALRVEAVVPYPWLVLDTDTTWPDDLTSRALNRVGARLRRKLFIREGTRTPARQRELWAQYVARGFRPPLVARPGTSPHEPRPPARKGIAADVGVLPTNVNLGAYPGARASMRAQGLCLPVPGENWHTQRGTAWRV